MPSVGDKTEMILGKLAVIDGKLDDLLKTATGRKRGSGWQERWERLFQI